MPSEPNRSEAFLIENLLFRRQRVQNAERQEREETQNRDEEPSKQDQREVPNQESAKNASGNENEAANVLLERMQCQLGQQDVDRCAVCNDVASGIHYGVRSCSACKGFFRRSIMKNMRYTCRGNQNCPLDRFKRNNCPRCRFDKCILVGMQRSRIEGPRKRMSFSFSQ